MPSLAINVLIGSTRTMCVPNPVNETDVDSNKLGGLFAIKEHCQNSGIITRQIHGRLRQVQVQCASVDVPGIPQPTGILHRSPRIGGLAEACVDPLGGCLELSKFDPSTIRQTVAFRVHPAKDLVCLCNAAVINHNIRTRDGHENEDEPGGEG